VLYTVKWQLSSAKCLVHKYTSTQVHKYTSTQVHKYTTTQLHNYTTTQPHNHTTTQLHNYTTTNVDPFLPFQPPKPVRSPVPDGRAPTPHQMYAALAAPCRSTCGNGEKRQQKKDKKDRKTKEIKKQMKQERNQEPKEIHIRVSATFPAHRATVVNVYNMYKSHNQVIQPSNKSHNQATSPTYTS
jgi:hypothetical protein